VPARGGSGRLTALLECVALAALALFAYFRWIAPTEAPLGLALGAAAVTVLPTDRERWRRAALLLLIGEWLVFTYLFLKTGDRGAALFSDGLRAGLAAATAIAAGVLFRRLWPGLAQARGGAAAETIVLVLMIVSALTLDWSFWPAMVGALAVFAAEAALLALAAGRLARARLVRPLAWGLSYLGQAAMAYAFLR
jgi:hypothetical protein